ncbi:MAG TPA: hypothetical protein VFO34_13285 [Candidatus Acidoferrales bacterium]|nr:hypothetical protein [Candidatus Acidoferrales bacterium]
MRCLIAARGALALCILTAGYQLVPDVAAQNSSTPDTRTIWPVRDGHLAIDSDSITYYSKRQRAPFIPIKTADVKRVCYDAIPHARGPSAWEATKTSLKVGAESGDPLGEVFWDVLATPAIAATAATVHSTQARKHFVSLYWEETDEGSLGNGYGGMSVESPKDSYLALLAQLQKITSVGWTDMSDRRFLLYQRYDLNWDHLSKQTRDKFDVYLSRPSRLGSAALTAGSYPSLLKMTSPDEGMLYVFRVFEKKGLAPVALVHVGVSASHRYVLDALADYNPIPGDDIFSEVLRIVTATHTLTVSPSQPYDYDRACPVLP